MKTPGIKKTTGLLISAFIVFLISMMSMSCVKPAPHAYAVITMEGQPSYEISHPYVDTLGIYHPAEYEYGMLNIEYEVHNTGLGEIHEYKVLFAILLRDGTYIYKEGTGYGVTDYATSIMDIETNGKQYGSIVVVPPVQAR